MSIIYWASTGRGPETIRKPPFPLHPPFAEKAEVRVPEVPLTRVPCDVRCCDGAHLRPAQQSFFVTPYADKYAKSSAASCPGVTEMVRPQKTKPEFTDAAR